MSLRKEMSMHMNNKINIHFMHAYVCMYVCSFIYKLSNISYTFLQIMYLIAPTLPKLVSYLKLLDEWELFGIFLLPEGETHFVKVKGYLCIIFIY